MASGAARDRPRRRVAGGRAPGPLRQAPSRAVRPPSQTDPREREADRMAARVAHAVAGGRPAIAGRADRASPDRPAGDARPRLRGSDVDGGRHPLPGVGRPLAGTLRARLEGAYGHDLADARVHTGPSAWQAASAMGARAFTVGGHVVLGRDVGALQSSSAVGVLAHEIAHVVQQAGDPEAVALGPGAPVLHGGAVQVAPLDPSSCATDCTSPVGTDGPKGAYRLVVYADKDSFGPFFLQAVTHKVGHSWLKLIDPSGRYWVYGFWPQQGYDAASPFADVAGCVWTDEGQGGHVPTAQQELVLTAAEFDRARATAQAICRAAPSYNLFGLQCTEFVKRVLDATGHGPLGGFGLLIESPNALSSALEEDGLLVGLHVQAAGSDRSQRGAVALDVEGRAQLAATLGNRLRLYALGRGEVGGGRASLTGGFGLTLRPRTPYVPNVRTSVGAAAGDLSPGRIGDTLGLALSGSAGLELPLDELLTIGAEYNLLASVARDDPLVHRFLISLRVPF